MSQLVGLAISQILFYRFFAFEAKSGRLEFVLDAKGAVFSSPAVAGDMAYVGDPTAGCSQLK